jgi:hypothetical protein
VLLFSTAVVFGRTLLQSFDQVIGQIPDDELHHFYFPILLVSMIAMPSHEVTVEIEMRARPALVAQWLCLRLLARVPRRSAAAHATAFRKTDK